jgi:hypothetical protein
VVSRLAFFLFAFGGGNALLFLASGFNRLALFFCALSAGNNNRHLRLAKE